MLFSTLFPVAFPALALAHFVALLSPGQDFFLVVGYSIRHKLHGSRFICLGIALGNAIYIAIIILGWNSIRDNPVLFSIVQILGATYLLWIGSRLLKSKGNDDLLDAKQEKAPSVVKQLLLGLNSALFNPKNALFYISIMAVILGNEVTLVQQVFCGLWMFFTVLLWNLLIAAIIGQPRIQLNLKRSLPLVERGSGTVLIFFGIALFIDFVSL